MRSAPAAGNHGGPSSQRDAKLSSNQPRDESILKGMLFGPRPLATVLVVRPSVLRRNNLARLFRALFHEGFRLAGLTLRSCTEAEALHITQRAMPLPNSTAAKTAESGLVSSSCSRVSSLPNADSFHEYILGGLVALADGTTRCCR